MNTIAPAIEASTIANIAIVLIISRNPKRTWLIMSKLERSLSPFIRYSYVKVDTLMKSSRLKMIKLMAIANLIIMNRNNRN